MLIQDVRMTPLFHRAEDERVPEATAGWVSPHVFGSSFDITPRNSAASGARVSILDLWSMRDSWNQWDLLKRGVVTAGSPAGWAKRSLLTGTPCDTMGVGEGGEGRIGFHLHYHEKYFIWLHPHRKRGHRLLVYHENEWEESISLQNMLKKKNKEKKTNNKKPKTSCEYPQIPKPESEGLFFFLTLLLPKLWHSCHSGDTRPEGDGGEAHHCAFCQRGHLLKPAVPVPCEWWRAGLGLWFSSLKAPWGLLWLFAPCSAGIFEARSELIAPGSVLRALSLYPLSKDRHLACPSSLSTMAKAETCVWAGSHPWAPLPRTNVVSVKQSPEQQHVPLRADGKFQRHKGYLGTDFKANKLDAEKKNLPRSLYVMPLNK